LGHEIFGAEILGKLTLGAEIFGTLTFGRLPLGNESCGRLTFGKLTFGSVIFGEQGAILGNSHADGETAPAGRASSDAAATGC